MNKLNLIIAFVAVFALIIGMKLWHHGIEASPAGGLAANIYSPPKEIPKFTLLDTKGKPFNNSSVWSHWSFIVFGSATHCSVECDKTLKTLATALQTIESHKQTPVPQVVFISTDAMDTPDILNKFTGKYDADFIGVTGDIKQVNSLAGLLPAPEKDSVLLIDPAGKLSGVFVKPRRTDAIVNDFKIIVQNEG